MSDPSHIIRAIEYWQIEKRNNPDYKHIAVIIAERITSRYFHVLATISQSIPLIAIQMNALKFEDHIAVAFTTILNIPQAVNAIDVQRVNTPADRAYWEQKAPQSMGVVDSIFELMRQMYPDVAFKYNQSYIKPTLAGLAGTFMTMRPRKSSVRLTLRISTLSTRD